MRRSKNKSKLWVGDDGGLRHFGKVYKSLIFCFFGLLVFSFVAGSSEMGDTYAESASVNASAKVLESCSVESTGSDHTATIVAGNYEQIGSDSIFNINCNDPNGYIIYAVGNSGDTEGNTSLISQTDGGDIATGLNTSGDTSNWSFKLSNPTENLTILSSFNDNSIIPNTRTAVAKREAGTTSPTVDSFHASYNAYISKTQPVDTYEGKVKYILFHPSTYLVPKSCNDGEGVRLKDGKCWSKSNVVATTWANASSYCTGAWHLPSQSEFNSLIQAYYPSASANGSGYKYEFNGDASKFTNDWGADHSRWWSSTETDNPDFAYRLYLESSLIDSYTYTGLKTYEYYVRCVSDDTEYNITYNLNSGSGVTPSQTVKADGNNVKLDSTTPSRSGYDFLGWCDKETTSDTCSGTTYPAGADYPITNTPDNTITLWAMWKQNLPSLTTFRCSSLSSNATTDTTDGITIKKVGSQCWMWEDYRTSRTWSQANSDCPSGWHLPSQSEFQTLLNSMGTGSQLYSAGWSGGAYWSSTANTSNVAYYLVVNSSSAFVSNYVTDYLYVRCVAQ